MRKNILVRRFLSSLKVVVMALGWGRAGNLMHQKESVNKFYNDEKSTTFFLNTRLRVAKMRLSCLL